VTVVAVTKSQPPESVRAAFDAGLTEFGENYVQEALAKIATAPRDAVWHCIGGLQANKTRPAAERFTWVQTVASARIAERLSQQRPYYAGDLQVCLQLAPEAAGDRSGVLAAELAALAAVVAGLPRLKLRGIMFMPRADLDPAALRKEFARARAVFDALRTAGHGVDTLSMGMSGDFELAIAEGSTMVRIGTTLFGERQKTRAE